MRNITLIVIHCSNVRPDETSSAAQIDMMHRRSGRKLGIIVGHHDLDPQERCPCIKDVAGEYADLQ